MYFSSHEVGVLSEVDAVRSGNQSISGGWRLLVPAALAISYLLPSSAAAVSMPYFQTATLALSNTCKTAGGSDTAEGALAQLRSQPQGLPEVIEAIGTCERQAQMLRQKEEKAWIQALGAKNKWDCSDARRLFRQ